ncbi:TPA: DDE-type integrase/transposase/recombinase [Pasteurella multocida]|uniref:transposase n=2 Tax=Pasteurella multocida TaxID=747 RepID=UPI0028DD7941|nr:DDE-type integrase/transposase/recombinase [Pasteurella multocida]HDR1218122.1 DDE-type integrase/transposase/recombinase [Pasteurella multocida]HDR1901031.1 DDE-type integrase/transposase/recombinase [Pasteurella multocida]HEA3250938.1 DDE-type integrase/transposase/recombinase [Pasteurella multocida]HEA3268803.1 DDE-type integrase/transposase/recombinase [Pasteurella multocida]
MAILPEKLLEIAQQAANAPHGKKGDVYAQACELLQVSYATLMRELKQFSAQKTRKQRSDKGNVALDIKEAQIISAYWLACRRGVNNKVMSSLASVLEVLRANNEIKAEYIDESTGEIRLLSESAVNRALRTYNLHPEQLSRPAPVNSMRSLHPNHCWQIDPSLCVLYYLKEQTDGGNGLNIMEEKEFYKNKPANVKKVENERVWRYVITDHASGVIYVEYVYGGESAENLCNCFINAMQKRHSYDPFCGVPKMVMLDPGSANTSAMFAHLCKQLGIHLQVNTPGKPRAKGQVEKSNDIVERQFESGLRFTRVSGLTQLNERASRWMAHFNGTAIHTRTQRTRYQVWSSITREQLVIAPSVEICRELMVTKLVSRKVASDLTVSFGGATYDVRNISEAMVGNTIMLGKNPYRPDCIQVQCVDENGQQYWTVVEPVKFNEFGFKEDAAIIGKEYKPHRKSEFEYNKETVERIAYDSETEEQIKAAKKAKTPLFGGRINPYKTIDEHTYVDFMPKRGQQHELSQNAKRVELVLVNTIEVAKRLKAKFGSEYSADTLQWLNQRYPNGMTEPELDELLAQPHLPTTAKPLRIVNG